jgi:hypothetical protein
MNEARLNEGVMIETSGKERSSFIGEPLALDC